MAISPDGRWLAASGDGGGVRMWEAVDGAKVATLLTLADGWACLLPDGAYKLHGVPAGEFLYTAGLCASSPVRSMTTSPPYAASPPTPRSPDSPADDPCHQPD